MTLTGADHLSRAAWDRSPRRDPFWEPSPARVLALADELRAALRRGDVARMIIPARQVVEDERGMKFISMPAVSHDYDLYINKTATIAGARAPGGAATVTSVVPVFSATSGRLLGVLDGATVTNLKCAAVTALVTDRCAARDSRVMGIIGSGVQARQQWFGVTAVRDIQEVRVYSRKRRNAAAFAEAITERAVSGGSQVTVSVCASAEQASRDVDILATATTSVRPLPVSGRLPDHVHINCMGGHTVDSRELPDELLRTSVLIVEDVDTAVAEAGPSHRAAVQLGVLETPTATGFPRRRTIFGSTGCAYLDLITCAYLVANPEER